MMAKKKLVRSRNGMILGVCRGVAEYFNVSVKWTRILTVVTMIFTGFFPVAFFYVLAAFLMKPEPGFSSAGGFKDSRVEDMARLRRRFDRLASRVRKAEDRALDREKDWERRLSA